VILFEPSKAKKKAADRVRRRSLCIRSVYLVHFNRIASRKYLPLIPPASTLPVRICANATTVLVTTQGETIRPEQLPTPSHNSTNDTTSGPRHQSQCAGLPKYVFSTPSLFAAAPPSVREKIRRCGRRTNNRNAPLQQLQSKLAEMLQAVVGT
jgi:hypothetical protein